jgi:integrase
MRTLLSKRPRYPTKKTLENIANHLSNFIEWMQWKSADWRALDYTGGVMAYQSDMFSGQWAAEGSGLSAGTVNNRIGEACSFLKWAAHRRLRDQFKLVSAPVNKRGKSGTSSVGHLPNEIKARAGGFRSDPGILRLPTEEEVLRWLRDVRLRRGPTKALMCTLVLETAIRIQEAVQWRVDTLPLDQRQWVVIGGNVQVTICYGAKGPKRHPDSDEGPPRIISVPISLAKKLDTYRSLRRVVLHGRWVQAAKSKSEMQSRRLQPMPNRLFLSDYTGRPFTDQAFYSGWKNVPSLPYKEWSPHLGRHYWACITLLRSQQEKAASIGKQLDQLPDDWITSQATTDIQLIIRPQLGHVSDETSQLYLKWIHGAVSLTKYTLEYHDLLDRIDD